MLNTSLRITKQSLEPFAEVFCYQVVRTEEPFNNRTYCQCSAEFHKQYFEAAIGKPIEVELEQSIISGAEYCIFKLHIGDFKTT